MNFEKKLGGMPQTPEQEAQQPKPVAENQQNVPDNTILGTAKDEEFPGSIVVKTKNLKGKMVGYAMRAKEDGTLEGNEISYQPDGTVGSIQRLNEGDISTLQQKGVIAAFEQAQKIDTKKKHDDAHTWLIRCFLKGESISSNDTEILEAKKSLESLSASEQESIAETFYNDRISNNLSGDSVRSLYSIYPQFKGTVFGEKIRQMEDSRLKEAGYPGFKG